MAAREGRSPYTILLSSLSIIRLRLQAQSSKSGVAPHQNLQPPASPPTTTWLITPLTHLILIGRPLQRRRSKGLLNITEQKALQERMRPFSVTLVSLMHGVRPCLIITYGGTIITQKKKRIGALRG